jgi:hypothetical protein
MNRDELIQIILGHGQLSEGALADAILAALPRWIPVSERLPKPSVPVLVIERYGAVAVAVFRRGANWQDFAAVAFGEEAYKNDAGWHSAASRLESYDVSHWMPLPPTPEQEPAP